MNIGVLKVFMFVKRNS